MRQKPSDAQRFHEEMFERLEDAADAAVLARFNAACPTAEYGSCEAFWLYLVRTSPSRKEAREKLEEFLKADVFDAYGEVRE